MEKAEIILKRAELFSSLTEKELIEVAKSGKMKQFLKGELIFSQGQKATGAYIIAIGKVKIYKLSSDGRQHILHVYNEGKMFAEAAMFSGNTYPAFAETLIDTTAFYLSKERFMNLIQRNPSLILKILGFQAAKLREFASRIESLSLKEVGPRLAKYIIEQAKMAGCKTDRGLEIKLVMNKTQLAAYLGTISETLSRAFSSLKKSNLIDEENNTLIIKNIESLENLAES